MGDISRHRDIYLNTRDAVPADLLGRCRLSRGDLTFLELGNYFTDVSQFRDPVFYLYAKQTVWREEVLPGANENKYLTPAKAILQLLAVGGAAAIAALANGNNKALALLPGAVGPAVGLLNNQINDLAADIIGVDEWIDRMLGKPIEKLDKNGKRKPEDYGFVGRFFQHFIEGVTQMLFANDVAKGSSGEWSTIDRIPPAEVTKVFAEAFTQYFPHEHTDQPPYVWDASKRPGKPMYEPAPRRERAQGIMGIVYEHYINYLAESLSLLEKDWRSIKPDDSDARRRWLVRVGKVLHGVEDWFFHSNVVELTRLHGHNPDAVPEAKREDFVKELIVKELKKEPYYTAVNRSRLERYFYRRLRFPIYSKGNRENTGGVASTDKSTLNWDHAYPAFPSTLDTAHTLLGALENIERKFDVMDRLLNSSGSAPSLEQAASGKHWADCVIAKFHTAGPEWSKIHHEKAALRGIRLKEDGRPHTPRNRDELQRTEAWFTDVMRELVPLVLTLLHQRERQRLILDVLPMDMPLDGSLPRPKPGVKPGKGQINEQLKRHVEALKPKADKAGVKENNYVRAARYFQECGSINQAGRDALTKAFEVDVESEKKKVNDETPGAGGFLIKFAVKLQTQIDVAEAVTDKHDKDDKPFSHVATDNGSQNEIVGSHSLMSKDTKDSSPFFDDAKVMGSVASLSVFQLLLDEVSAPGGDWLNWQKILRYLIRFPTRTGGWERQAMARFIESGRRTIPKFADIPDLAELKKARMPAAAAAEWQTGERAAKLRQMYVDLEKTLTRYRYP